jgi:hypothetical protein
MAIPLRAALTLDSAQFQAGVARARASLRTLQSAFGGLIKLARNLTLAFAGLLTGLGAIILRQTALISSMRNLSQQLGVNIQFLQRFRFAAEQSGSSARAADNAIQRLNRRLAEAVKGTGSARDVLRQYNIALRDGQGELRSTQDIMMDVADAMQRTESGAERNRIAFQLFGREGQALVNTLQDGSAALQEQFTLADRLGIVLSQSAADGVTRFGDAWDRLKSVIGGFTNSLTAGLAPALEKIVDQLVEFITKAVQARGGFEQLGRYLAGEFLRIMEAVVLMFVKMFNTIVHTVNQIMPQIMRFSTDTGDQLDRLNGTIGIVRTSIERLGNTRFWQSRFTESDRQALVNRLEHDAALVQKIADQMGMSLSEALSPENLPNTLQILEQHAESLRQQLEFQLPFLDQSAIQDWFASLQAAIRGVEIRVTEGLKDAATDSATEATGFWRRQWNRLTDFMKETFPDFTENLSKTFGKLTEVFGEVKERMKEIMSDKALHDPIETLAQGFKQAFQVAEDALTRFITSGKLSFSDLGRHIRDTLARAFIQQSIMQPLMGAFGFQTGTADAGGRGVGGKPVMIGTGAQPELFIPDGPGTFMPRNTLQNMQSQPESTTVNYNINAVDARSFRDLVAQDPEFLYAVTQVGARRTPR